MPAELKLAVRLLVVAVLVVSAVAVLSVLFDYGQVTPANAACDDSRDPKCENRACVSSCWADGTVHNPHTYATRTAKAPAECFPGDGCVTHDCP